MKSKKLGKNISEVEVTNISKHGLWILTGEKELFLSYEDFPWFKDAPLGKIFKVEEPTPGHFYWPDLDVDLTVEIIEHPDKFSLIARLKKRVEVRNFEEFYEKLQTELKKQPSCSDHPEYPCVKTLNKKVPNDIIKIESKGITVRSHEPIHKTMIERFISKDTFRIWYNHLVNKRSASLCPGNSNNPVSQDSRITGAIIAECFPDIIAIGDSGRAIRLNRPDC